VRKRAGKGFVRVFSGHTGIVFSVISNGRGDKYLARGGGGRKFVRLFPCAHRTKSEQPNKEVFSHGLLAFENSPPPTTTGPTIKRGAPLSGTTSFMAGRHASTVSPVRDFPRRDDKHTS